MTSAPTRMTNSESRAATRTSLLRAAADILMEGGEKSSLDQLTIQEICARAGRSTGAFYGNWKKGLVDFAPELVMYLQGEDFFSQDLEPMKAAAIPQEGSDFRSVLSAVADTDLKALRSNPVWAPQVELLIRFRDRSDVVEAGKQGYQKVDTEFGQVYADVLAEFGLSLRPSCPVERLGLILQALVEGFTLRSLMDPDSIEDSDGESLFAQAVAAIVEMCTLPED